MRCGIVPENDIREALQTVEQAIEAEKRNRAVGSMTGRSTQ
jgi:hypothetical protein